MENEILVTRMIECMKHATGEGGRDGHRNFYCAGGGHFADEALQLAVNYGYMRKRPNHLDQVNNSFIYHVTPSGFDFLEGKK